VCAHRYSRLICSILIAIALAPSALSQDFHFGIKVGVPITEYFETGVNGGDHVGLVDYSSATRRYLLGVSTELRLNNGFGLEADAIYRRMGYVRNFLCICESEFTTSTYDVKGNSWDFPLMAKYRFGRRLQPYMAGGVALRYIGPVRALGSSTVQDAIGKTTVHTPIDTSAPLEMQKRFYPGLTVASGIEFRLGPLRLLPEFRYIRWTSDIPDADTTNALHLPPNQAEFLLGFLF